MGGGRDDAGLETGVGEVGRYGAGEGVIVGGDGGVRVGGGESHLVYGEVEEARGEMFDFDRDGALCRGRGVDVWGEMIDAGVESCREA